MLDLTKLAKQMQGIGEHLRKEAEASRLRLEVAQKLLHKAQWRQAELNKRRESWQERMTFSAPTPIEPLLMRSDVAIAPGVHVAIASDGSQIAPNHHEIAYCYLINVGRVVLYYGESRRPILDSVPEVFYQPEDLYASRQWGIRTEEWMGYRRTVSEAQALADLAEGVQAEATQRGVDIPTLALVDGSLIYWFLESLPNEVRDPLLEAIFAAWERMRLAKVPLVGYMSASRSGESLSFLRLQACPYPEPDCFKHCPMQADTPYRAYGDKSPCQVFDPLRDATFWASVLSPGQRSPLWRSNQRILSLYNHQYQVYFCYVHVGAEIARLDLPAWVVEDRELFDLALSLVMAQVQKGYGYPVALAEAHNQAVVRGGDRARFFAMLEREMIKAGLQNVGTSYKETRKRGSIA
ncbi:MAG TPA: DNA double-strand break repair nuclease NurA [Oscillatoriaceae cyanobacterium M33_DOE_052]|uniref:DNA double-strand break repair nuclease NurA n=1 Tax=Planktothricoides sp. SpSt-374 TaxID=2282167 RepID=A0A7C3VMN4_9CYAN|nr:DNA double-strand break repair nuclease NurA [Oscillatoriaceae cyanobacterium M33_DOE_052]